ncbi:MAG: tRNA (guanosine(46)-N7)-methyltransferase TrmB [Lentisphaerae bacterium]|nr:tRNA (guanosine(46)-N7)-methyltransferase TrmB [Lentisphaerota bacterium]
MRRTERNIEAALPEKTAIVTPASWTQALDLAALYPAKQPLEVDVGCGKGRFLAARAAACPGRNFLGVDRQLARLRPADRKVVRAGLANVRLLRVEASYAVTHLLPPGTVSRFYIFFPDPWPKRRHSRRRLFNPGFRDALHKALAEGGEVHTATDHGPYAEVIRGLFQADPRFAPAPGFEPLTEEERTEFEMIFVRQNAPIARQAYRKASLRS